MKLQSKAPIFLVGAPRSGTTLLQSLLAAHPQIASFPETKFFQYAVPRYEPRRQRLGMISQGLKPRLNKLFGKEICRPEMLDRFPQIPLLSLYARSFVKILDSLTAERGKSLWLEKTPEHIYYIKEIEKFIPGVKIIHLLRGGADVVASLYDVTHKYPQWWDGAWDIDLCLERWKRPVEITRSYLDRPNHIMVKYEELVENSEDVLQEICRFLGLDFTDSMVEDYQKTANKVSLSTEPWKASTREGITNANSKKFYQIFDETERQYVLNCISEFDPGKMIN